MREEYSINRFLDIWKKENYTHTAEVKPISDKEGKIIISIENDIGIYTKYFQYKKITDEFNKIKVKINELGSEGFLTVNSDILIKGDSCGILTPSQVARLIESIDYKDFEFLPEKGLLRIKKYLKSSNENHIFVLKDADENLKPLEPIT